jgi:hypothetical protein
MESKLPHQDLKALQIRNSLVSNQVNSQASLLLTPQ